MDIPTIKECEEHFYSRITSDLDGVAKYELILNYFNYVASGQSDILEGNIARLAAQISVCVLNEVLEKIKNDTASN